jgi:uncharacterized protein (DUF608 family)
MIRRLLVLAVLLAALPLPGRPASSSSSSTTSTTTATTTDEDDALASQLVALRFVEVGSVRAQQRFGPLRQCAEGILESTTQWSDDAAHPGTTMEYMYDVTDPQHPGAPPVGMRSSVPLGGLGTGSVELRADGRFADWSIENQGPALAADKDQNAKLPLMAEAVLGVRSGSYATSLRTHDHAATPSIPLAEALSYSGSFPFSRLALDDPRSPVNATLYAWSPLKLWDENRSGTPAISFSLVVSNPSRTDPTNVSLWVSLPLASAMDVTRLPKQGSGTPTVHSLNVTSAAACLKACASHEDCTSWSLAPPPPPPQNCSALTIPTIPYCTLKAPVQGDWPLVHQPGTSTGLPRRSLAWLQKQPNQSGAPHDLGPDVGWDRLIPTNYHCWSVNTTTDPTSGMDACARSCETDGQCEAWSYVAYRKQITAAAPARTCSLYGGAPAVQQYLPGSGSTSGVKGRWKKVGGNALVHERTNAYLPCGWNDSAVAANPHCKVDASVAVSDFTLAADADVTVRVATAASLQELWNDFTSDSQAELEVEAAASHGAIEATALLAPGETRTISVVFAWNVPERDYAGDALGNFYSERFASSMDVAKTLTGDKLLTAARDASALNRLLANTTMPTTFVSFLLNSLATQVKNSVWVREQTASSGLANGHLPDGTAGGRFRTYEGLPGCDLDPIHVSDYHMQPYLQFFPALAKNTIFTGWAMTQLCPGGWGKCNAATVANSSGAQIQEWLGNWGWPNGRLVGPMDAVGGQPRKMADGATIFALSSLAAFQQTASMSFLEAVWPHVAAACRWQIAQVSSNGTLPNFWNTYDYMSTDGFDNVAYNAIAHLAGMRACGTIAEHVKDTTALGAAADASFAAVQKGLQDTLWTGTHWRAAVGVCRSTGSRPCSYQSWPWGDAVMSGSLHGQSWASALGLGPLMPVAQLASHVRTEKEMACTYDPVHCFVGQQMMQLHPDNGQPGGTTGLLNQTRWANDVDPAMTMDNAANAMWWANASFDSPLLQPALRMIENHHTKLNDIWNWKDIHHGPEGETCSGASPTAPTGPALAGNPELNGHYTRQLQGWMIAKAAVGQTWNAHTRLLTLRPAAPRAGDRLPWFTDAAAGIVQVGETGSPPRLEVHLGKLAASVEVVVGSEVWSANVGEERAPPLSRAQP